MKFIFEELEKAFTELMEQKGFSPPLSHYDDSKTRR